MQPDIEAFLQAQRLDRGAADKTIEAYARDLAQFAAWLHGHGTPGGPRKTSSIEAAELNAFLAGLARSGHKPASIARKTSALRQFFRFCCLERGLEANPAEQLSTPRGARRLPGHLSVEQVTELLAAAEQGLPYARIRPPALAEALRARDRAMVYLLYATGLRVSELTGLTSHQLDLKSRYVRVRGKGDKERIVPFAPVAAEKLETYLERHRPLLVRPGSNVLFPGLRPEHARPDAREHSNQKQQGISRQAFWKLLLDLALQAGLGTSLSPHKLRHSFATHLLAAGMNLRSLQQLLGHSDLSTTQIYAHVTPGHLKSAHRRFHPRGK